jgi:hypothetical protein
MEGRIRSFLAVWAHKAATFRVVALVRAVSVSDPGDGIPRFTSSTCELESAITNGWARQK